MLMRHVAGYRYGARPPIYLKEIPAMVDHRPLPRSLTGCANRESCGTPWTRSRNGGLSLVVAGAIERAGRTNRTYLTGDIDVLDPAFAPGTGTPEPGGLTTRELLRAVRRIASSLDLCAMDIVEVPPPYDPSGITALAAHRVVLAALAGTGLRKSGRTAHPQQPRSS
jgi:hypothetical protein